MPTAFTNNIPEGITLRQYMLQCVRGMGLLQGYPLEEPVPTSLPLDTYHKDRLIEAQKEVTRLKKLSPEELELECERDRQRVMEARNTSREGIEEKRAAYEAMLQQVKEWEAPSDLFAGFKEFMGEQITFSVDVDCLVRVYPPKLEPADWHALMLRRATGQVDHHHRLWEADQKYNREKNAWLKAFWDSLPPKG